jgi:hypothetical protein
VSGSTGKSLAGDVNRALGHASHRRHPADPKQMLEDFARAYVEAGKKGLTSLQGQIRSQLGGTSNIKELLPLLEEGGQKRLADALKNALAGAGTRRVRAQDQHRHGSAQADPWLHPEPGRPGRERRPLRPVR